MTYYMLVLLHLLLIIVACLIPLTEAGWFSSQLTDPHGKFCGKDNCYEILGLNDTATKADIKKAYRQLSLRHHPDKAGRDGEGEQMFNKLAAANRVLGNDETRQKYDYFVAHPDAYWEEYGQWWVMEYPPASDVRWVLLGIVLFISMFQPFHQYTKYQRAVKFLIMAAERNLNVREGGTPLTLQLRKEAEDELIRRKVAAAAGGAGGSDGGNSSAEVTNRKAVGSSLSSSNHSTGKGGGGGGSSSGGSGGKLTNRAKDNKMLKMRKKLEPKELREVITEMAYKVQITGAHRKPRWQDVPLVVLPQIPFRMAQYFVYLARWYVLERKGKLSESDRTYWARRSIGKDAWDELEPEQQKAAFESEVWKGGEALEEWKWETLHGGDKRDLRQRKAFSKQEDINNDTSDY